MSAANGNVTIMITCSIGEASTLLGAGREATAQQVISVLLGAADRSVEGTSDVEVKSEQALPEVIVDALCRECEGGVDPLTRRHVDGAAEDCRYEDVPEQELDVVLECPACGAQEISEVNVGEIWDEVTNVTFEAGVLTITVDQLSEIDRNGDGWVCARCTERLRLPRGYLIGFEYE